MEPLVSILMTAYNREQYIGYAIRSVLDNAYQNWELIIVDDGSSDQTIPIAKSFAETDGRIRIYINEKNLGDYPNRNKAATYAKGKYLQYVDSDDLLYPDTLTEVVADMEAHPQADLGMVGVKTWHEQRLFKPGEAVLKNFFHKPFLGIGPGGTIIKRSFFESIGGYPTAYGPANDNFFNLKAAAKGTVLLFPKEFVFYRIHDGQEINNKKSYLLNNYRYVHDAISTLELGLSTEQKSWLLLKNKRRFAVNLIKAFKQSKNLAGVIHAAKQVHFTAGDFLQGIFHTKKLKGVYKARANVKSIEKLSRVAGNFGDKLPFASWEHFYNSKINKDNDGVVVTLHRITSEGDATGGPNAFIEISAANLENFIKKMQQKSVRFVSLTDLKNAVLSHKLAELKSFVHVSFDDGYADNFNVAYPILKKYKIPFSIFVCSNFIDERRPFIWWYIIEELLKRKREFSFDKYGFSINSTSYKNHSYNHLFTLTVDFIMCHLDRDRDYFKSTLKTYAGNDIWDAIPEMLNWHQLNSMLAEGLCEAGVHSRSHPRFISIASEKQIAEINHCRKRLAEECNVYSDVFAYPYGAIEDIGYINTNSETLKAEKIKIAFTTIPAPLNDTCNPHALPRVFINDTFNDFTLRSRINGNYQRFKVKEFNI